jgi:tripartite ATP-independent transporter DctP family solute receptor
MSRNESEHFMMNRRTFTAGAATLASIGILRFPAGAAEFTYKFGNDNPETHPVNVRMKDAAAKIKEETGGRFELQLFPNNQLGGDTAMLTQLRSGAVQFLTFPDTILASIVPVAAINGMGFIFESYNHVWQAMDGQLGAYVRSQIEAASLYAFEKEWNNGFRQITSSTHPIDKVADLDGFKIRVPVSPLVLSLFKSLGASPTPINFSEVYTSLQTHVVDGQENPVALIETAHLYEVQKYLSLTNHMWNGYWFLANTDAWNKLPKQIRDVVEKNVNAAAVLERSDLENSNAAEVKTLATKGLAINTPDRAPFKKRLVDSGFYKQWHQTYGDKAWAALEKYTGPLG